MNPIEKVKKQKLINAPLAIESKKIDEEVQQYKDKLKDYGINNSTRKKIDEGFKNQEEIKKEIGEKSALNILIEAFAPFSIVTYKTLDEVCNDHKLVISSIGNYDKAIPDENIEDIDSFFTKLKTVEHSTLNKIRVIKNNYFSFSEGGYSEGCLVNKYNLIGSDEMFKIAAPKNHFVIPKNHIKIGNEYSSINESKPKFSYEFKFNRPNFELDPIVFVPIKFMNKVFCVIVTAWDKVADDSRILSKL